MTPARQNQPHRLQIASEIDWLIDLARHRALLSADEQERLQKLAVLAVHLTDDVARTPDVSPETFRSPEVVVAWASEQYGVVLSEEDSILLRRGQKTGLITTQDGQEEKAYVVHLPEAGPQVYFQAKKPGLVLKDDYLGHRFREEDKNNLQKYGDMGRLVELIDRHHPDKKFKDFIGVDKQTRQLTVMRLDSIAGKIRRMSHLKGVLLTPLLKERLLTEAAIRLDGLKAGNGAVFSSYVRVSARKKGLRFDPVKD